MEYIYEFSDAVLNRLILVEIYVPKNQDPTNVFQSINGKGTKLTPSDLVRNLVSQKFAPDPLDAEEFFVDQWQPFEERIAPNLEDYLFVLGLQYDDTVTKSTLYDKYADRWRLEPNNTPKAVMKDLNSYLRAYRALVPQNGRYSKIALGKPLRSSLDRIQRLDPPGVTRSYLVRLLREAENGSIQETDAAKAFSIVESFLVRRGVLGYEPTGLHALFKSLWRHAKSDPEAIIAEIEKRATIQKPTDDDILNRLPERQFYRSRVAKYVLQEIEVSMTSRGSVNRSFLRDATIDHVLPQKHDGRGSAWIAAGSKKQRENALHTIGNLVLIEHIENSSKGSKSWTDARRQFSNETYSKSATSLSEFKNWDVASIRSRSDELSKWVTTRWQDPFSG
jgi:hypothetical protein